MDKHIGPEHQLFKRKKQTQKQTNKQSSLKDNKSFKGKQLDPAASIPGKVTAEGGFVEDVMDEHPAGSLGGWNKARERTFTSLAPQQTLHSKGTQPPCPKGLCSKHNEIQGQRPVVETIQGSLQSLETQCSKETSVPFLTLPACSNNYTTTASHPTVPSS